MTCIDLQYEARGGGRGKVNRATDRTISSFREREGFAGLDMWSVLVVHSEQHVICRWMEGGARKGPR